MPTANPTDNLSEKFESFFFGREVWEREASVSLDDADGGEMREVESAGDGLSANQDVDLASLDVVVKSVE